MESRSFRNNENGFCLLILIVEKECIEKFLLKLDWMKNYVIVIFLYSIDC